MAIVRSNGGASKKVTIDGKTPKKKTSLKTVEYPKTSKNGLYNDIEEVYLGGGDKIVEIDKDAFAYYSRGYRIGVGRAETISVLRYNKKTGTLNGDFSNESAKVYNPDQKSCSGFVANRYFKVDTYTHKKLIEIQLKNYSEAQVTELISDYKSTVLCVNRKDPDKIYMIGKNIYYLDRISKTITKVTTLENNINQTIYDSYFIDNKLYLVLNVLGDAEIVVIDLEKGTMTTLFKFVEKFDFKLPSSDPIRFMNVSITDKNIYFTGSIKNADNSADIHFKYTWNIENDTILKSEKEMPNLNHGLRVALCKDGYSYFVTYADKSDKNNRYYNFTNTIVAYKEEEQ